MKYEMKLQPKYFEYIKNGTKRIELRLNDEKRRNIKMGDKILFLKEPNCEEKIEVRVVEILKYETFSDLFKDFDIEILSDFNMTKEELLNDLQNFYTLEKQKEYGVLGIRFQFILNSRF